MAVLFGSKPKVALFIDGSNFFATVSALGMANIDYNKIRAYFGKREVLFRSYYFTAVHPSGTPEADKLRPIIDFLKWNNWQVFTKPVKEFHDPVTSTIKVKGNMDGELITEMMLLQGKVDHMVLFSGDGDFCHTVRALQMLGTQVTVVSSTVTKPAMMSNELRGVCNKFIELANMRATFLGEFKSNRSKG